MCITYICEHPHPRPSKITHGETYFRGPTSLRDSPILPGSIRSNVFHRKGKFTLSSFSLPSIYPKRGISANPQTLTNPFLDFTKLPALEYWPMKSRRSSLAEEALGSVRISASCGRAFSERKSRCMAAEWVSQSSQFLGTDQSNQQLEIGTQCNIMRSLVS